MIFTKLHYFIACLLMAFASIIFSLLSTFLVEAQIIFLGLSMVTGLYALFAGYKTITFDRLRVSSLDDEAMQYKCVCPRCGELLRGHELQCPRCGEPQNYSPIDTDEV